jgi:N-methylhydantoinase A
MEQIPENAMEYVYSLDMRYLKQYHELNVVITKKEIEEVDKGSISNKFHPEHYRLYGYSLKEEKTPIELINIRLLAIGKTVKPTFKQEDYSGEDPSQAFKRRREIWIPSKQKFEEVSVFDGAQLQFGNKIDGPAIIEQVNTTTLITPEFCVLCDKFGSYTMVMKSKQDEVKDRLF